MIILTKNIDLLKGNDLVELQCTHCNKSFFRTKTRLTTKSGGPRTTFDFCSRACHAVDRTKSQSVICKNCGKEFTKLHSEMQRSKTHFCGRSCAATYNNLHKTSGNRRSKLENWVETKLRELYPDLDFMFNMKETIGSELDIYIPSLKLAFEMNGIFHYEPIHGQDKLDKVKVGDRNKFYECQRRNISLCSIDTSGMVNFKETRAQPYLKIITDIIDELI